MVSTAEKQQLQGGHAAATESQLQVRAAFDPRTICGGIDDEQGFDMAVLESRVDALTAEQALACIEYELQHLKRQGLLALLSVHMGNSIQRTPVQLEKPRHIGKTLLRQLSPADQAFMLRVLMLCRSHLRCPLDGSARADLQQDVGRALALLDGV